MSLEEKCVCVCVRVHAYLQRCQQIMKMPHTVLDLLVLNGISLYFQIKEKYGSPFSLLERCLIISLYLFG